MQQPRVRVPRTAKPGEVIEVRTLVEHPMDTGLRAGSAAGQGAPPPPRNMLSRFVARMNGEQVFAADLRNGTSANPYHVFFVRIERTSEFEFVWTDEAGRAARATARVSAG